MNISSPNYYALCRQVIEHEGLKGFVRLAWDQVESCEYMHNWHHDIICDALQAVTLGEKRKISIWVPPGTTKTLITGVFWPAWAWLIDPTRKSIYASYGGNLSLKAARQMRQLVNSTWFREVSRGIRIPQKSSRAAGFFENNRQGFRFSTSTGGEVTGRHAHDLVGDDLNKAIDATALSGIALESAWQYWSEVLPTRQSDPSVTTMVQIGQRIHEDDVGGRWARLDPNVEVICFAMRFDPDHPYCHPDDPREPGELLWPERFSEEQVLDLETSLGPTVASAQLQQRPIPPGGQLLKIEYFENRGVFPNDIRRALDTQKAEPGQLWRIYGDLTFKGKANSDYVVFQLWCRRQNNYYLISQIRGQWGFRQTKEALRGFIARYPIATQVKIEDAANAPAIVDDIKSEIPGLLLAKMGGGVLSRVQQVESLWASGSVFLPENAPWMPAFLTEHLGYDGLGTRHDDTVSASSLALLDLKGSSSWANAWNKIT